MAQSIVVTREYDAPAIDVFRAWTEPPIMRRWLAATAEADVRVGGRYRLENRGDDGQVHAFAGEYLVVEHARRLVMTFGVADAVMRDGPVPTEPETLEISFEAVAPTSTRLVLTNTWEHTLSADDLEGVREGWASWLEMLSF